MKDFVIAHPGYFLCVCIVIGLTIDSVCTQWVNAIKARAILKGEGKP